MRLLIVFWVASLAVHGQSVQPAPNRIFDTAKGETEAYTMPTAQQKQLIKAGVGLPLLRQSTFTPYWLAVGLNAAIERKLSTGLAIVGGLESNYSFSQQLRLYSLEMPVGLRYYFSVGKRMRQRADRHSFFSHYVGFQTHNVLLANLQYANDPRPLPELRNYYRGQFLKQTVNVGVINEPFNLLQHAYFQLGSQFRVSPSSYLDVNVVVPVPWLIYHKFDNTLSTPSLINVSYGIAWPR